MQDDYITDDFDNPTIPFSRDEIAEARGDNLALHFCFGNPGFDIHRIAYYLPNQIIAVEEGRESFVYIAPSAWWHQVDPKRPGPVGRIKEMVDTARQLAMDDAQEKLTGEQRENLRRYCTENATSRSYREIMAILDHVAYFPDQYGVRVLQGSEMDNRTAHRIFPLGDDTGWDILAGNIIGVEQCRQAYFKDNGWGAAQPDMEMLGLVSNKDVSQQDYLHPHEAYYLRDVQSTDRQHANASVMAWFIYEHIGQTFFDRLAHLLAAPRKEVECLVIPQANAGKSTLWACLEAAFGQGAIVTLYAGATFGVQSRNQSFTLGKQHLKSAALVIADEADKCELPADLLNSVCDDYITTHAKFEMDTAYRRTANLVLSGADWPQVDFSVQGAKERAPAAHYRESPAISSDTRRRLLSHESITYLVSYVLDAMSSLAVYDEDGITDMGRDHAQLWRDSVVTPRSMERSALVEVAEEGGVDDYIRASILRESVANHSGLEMSELSKTTKWNSLVRSVFPNVSQTVRKLEGKSVRVWTGLRSLVPEE